MIKFDKRVWDRWTVVVEKEEFQHEPSILFMKNKIQNQPCASPLVVSRETELYRHLTTVDPNICVLLRLVPEKGVRV